MKKELTKEELKELKAIADKLPTPFMERVNHYRRLKRIYRKEGTEGVGKYLKPYLK